MEVNLVDRAVKELAMSGIKPTLVDGKICYQTNQKPGGPWIYSRYSKHNCVMLKTFIYELISKRLPPGKRFIPSECQSCYKVVVRPESYDQLLVLKQIMNELRLPGKCGIEKRESVDALYGGYFYCYGIEDGLKRLEQVKAVLIQHDMADMDCFLKRGCTEYEADFGPSDKWNVSIEQLNIEKTVFSRVEIDNFKLPQDNEDIERIMASWEKFANKLGPVYKGSYNYKTYGDELCQNLQG